MFKKAERKSSKIKLAITGPSGSGKTFSALRMAKGLCDPGKRIAVIDTENGSASLYAEQFDFDVFEIHAPFYPAKYIEAIKLAEKLGYDVLIIDSISHEWAAEGGILRQKESDEEGKAVNKFTSWAPYTKKHESFKNAFLHARLHTICTIRSKQKYVVQEDEKGKSVPMKIGLDPVQRDGIEFEFTLLLDCNMNHEALATKDRTQLFTDKVFTITEETGEELKRWILSAPALEDPEQPPTPSVFERVEAGIAKCENLTDIEDCGMRLKQVDGKVTPDEYKKLLMIFKKRKSFLELPELDEANLKI